MRWLIGSTYLWFRKQVTSFWLRQLADIPKPSYTMVDTSATRAMRDFMRSQTLGTTVFWAVSESGKTAAMTSCDSGRRVLLDWNFCVRPLAAMSEMGPLESDERMSYTDAVRLVRTENGKVNAVEWFCWMVGGAGQIGDCFPRDGFTTVILDHFDRAMDSDEASAMQLVRRLTADSVHSGKFNVLVALNNPRHAHSLLRVSLWQMQLLGPPLCGKCTQEELEQLCGITCLAMDVGLQSGVIGLAVSARTSRVSDEMQLLHAVQKGKLWSEGESLLQWYRSATV